MEMKMKCRNPRCNYVWDYKGRSKFYVTCPHCYNKVKIELGEEK